MYNSASHAVTFVLRGHLFSFLATRSWHSASVGVSAYKRSALVDVTWTTVLFYRPVFSLKLIAAGCKDRGGLWHRHGVCFTVCLCGRGEKDGPICPNLQRITFIIHVSLCHLAFASAGHTGILQRSFYKQSIYIRPQQKVRCKLLKQGDETWNITDYQFNSPGRSLFTMIKNFDK